MGRGVHGKPILVLRLGSLSIPISFCIICCHTGKACQDNLNYWSLACVDCGCVIMNLDAWRAAQIHREYEKYLRFEHVPCIEI